MALPTQADLRIGGFIFNGVAFVDVEAKLGIDTLYNGFMFNGESFVAPNAGVTGAIVTIDGVAYGSVVKVNGVAVAAIQKINGVVAQT